MTDAPKHDPLCHVSECRCGLVAACQCDLIAKVRESIAQELEDADDLRGEWSAPHQAALIARGGIELTAEQIEDTRAFATKIRTDLATAIADDLARRGERFAEVIVRTYARGTR